MSGKRFSGLIGVVVGGAWLLHNMQYYQAQGFTAVGMPIIITVLGLVYLVRG